METLHLFPSGEFPIEKIDKKGIYFKHEGSLIMIPHKLIALNSCISCVYFNYEDRTSNSCKAFPKGIPNEIFLGKNDHKDKFAGDGGIVYKKRK